MSFNCFRVSSSNPPRQSASEIVVNNNTGVSAPQSDNPSPWTSKPVSAVLPPPDSTPQMPTPDQSASARPVGERDFTIPQFPGRGKRLSMEEELSLVRVARKVMGHYDVERLPKKYWLDVSNKFGYETGRSYSWQSCQRRTIRMIELRRTYKDFEGRIDLLDPKTQREIQVMSSCVNHDIDTWIRECDECNAQFSRQLKEENAEQEAKRAAEAEREAKRTAEAEEEERQDLEAELEASRKRKQDRVRKWLDSLPPADEMQPGVGSRSDRRKSTLDQYFGSSRQRDRSRSPRREENSYRQRSRSPRGHRAPQSTTSTRPSRALADHLKHHDIFVESSDETNSLDSQDIDLPPEQLTIKRPLEQPPHTAYKCQLDAARRLTDSIDDIALDFSTQHLQPLIMHVAASNLDSKFHTLDMVDLACLDMFRSVATMTMELFNAMSHGKPT